MEPMALGSPSGSPLPSSSGYLPTFLLGDTPTAAPRTNTLSPTKGRTSMAFGQSPLGGGGSASFSIQSPEPTPGTNHRSMMHSRFGLPAGTATTGNQQPGLNHNTSVSGPPVQGLFDSFRNEKQLLQTPTKAGGGGQQHSIVGTANQSMLNESYLNNSGFNVSRVMSPIPVSCQQQEYARNTSFVSPLSPQSTSFYHQGGAGNQPSAPTGSNYWITVFGFPQSASTTILSHFSQCGAIIEKVFATANGNWVHLRFTSRLECDKALNYNGKIIAQNLMIGVQYCNDPAIVGKENNDERTEYSLSRIRSLTHIAYKNAQNPTDVAPSPNVPKRSSGIVNKAMDLFFGW